MEIVNGKAFLRIGGQVYAPGEQVDIPEVVAEKLVKAGMVQKATKTPRVEKAVKAKPVEISDYSELPYAELKEMCKERDLPVHGKKAELIERLEGE